VNWAFRDLSPTIGSRRNSLKLKRSLFAVYRYLLPPANRFDGKSDGKNFFGLLLLNFTVRLASGLCESLQIMEISADRFAEFGKS
jgi:hypothetical protein